MGKIEPLSGGCFRAKTDPSKGGRRPTKKPMAMPQEGKKGRRGGKCSDVSPEERMSDPSKFFMQLRKGGRGKRNVLKGLPENSIWSLGPKAKAIIDEP